MCAACEYSLYETSSCTLGFNNIMCFLSFVKLSTPSPSNYALFLSSPQFWCSVILLIVSLLLCLLPTMSTLLSKDPGPLLTNYRPASFSSISALFAYLLQIWRPLNQTLPFPCPAAVAYLLTLCITGPKLGFIFLISRAILITQLCSLLSIVVAFLEFPPHFLRILVFFSQLTRESLIDTLLSSNGTG